MSKRNPECAGAFVGSCMIAGSFVIAQLDMALIGLHVGSFLAIDEDLHDVQNGFKSRSGLVS
jgi:hypothetical protein